MKLSNFTSMDPGEKGRVKGLQGASQLDRQIWAEFHSKPVPMAAEAEALWNAHLAHSLTDDEEGFSGPTETTGPVTVRRAQTFFRRTVLRAYQGRCCVTGIALKEFLVASHIVPWAESEEGRVNPSNGLCLSRLYDAAFDRALVTFDEDLRLVVGRRLRDHFTLDALRTHFAPHEGIRLSVPVRFPPAQRFLEHHRARFATTGR